MPMFKVTVTANMVATENVYEVEAENEDDARESALTEAKSDRDGWEPGEFTATEVVQAV